MHKLGRRFSRIGLSLEICLSLLWFCSSGLAQSADQLPTAGAETLVAGREVQEGPAGEPRLLLIGMGDSLTQGTMDGTNNWINTLNAYLHRIALSLSKGVALHFRQPLFDIQENRLRPYVVPTNLGVDGADAFSLEGIEYYKRAGVDESFVSPEYLADRLLPGRLGDKFDKVLYPINLLARKPVSQIDSAIWLLDHGAPRAGIERALVVFWVGNNDSGTAALGAGGSNPEFIPIPLDEIGTEIKPLLKVLLEFGETHGAVSFEPYTRAAIERNLTDLDDFADQYDHLLRRLETGIEHSDVDVNYLLLTLPYYSAVGYLFDSDDLEFYLQKLAPDYTIPPTFKRVAPPGEPITDPLQGDRISLLTFGFMYALLDSGYSVGYVNQILERDGEQRDGLVLSEEEQHFIMSRIDSFNAAIKRAASSRGSNFHLVDIGRFLNDALTGKIEVIVNGDMLSRKWIRGGAFTLDGVHPGYTGQSIVANFVLEEINAIMGFNAPPYDLSLVHAMDPYVDQDGDGWAPGPDYAASGLTEILFLFRDPDDGDSAEEVDLPPEVWDLISDVLLEELVDIPTIRLEAERLGM